MQFWKLHVYPQVSLREMAIRNMSGDPLGSPKQLNIIQFTAFRFHTNLEIKISIKLKMEVALE